MRGNEVIVTANPRGVFLEGTIGTGFTPKPGTIMQIDHSVAMAGGRNTWVPFNMASDGDRPASPLAVLREDNLQGKTMTDAYAAGDRAFLYVPVAGEELNCILGDVAGTGDDQTAGARLSVDDGTGKLVTAAGQHAPFQLKENVTDPTADTIIWVVYNGY